MSKRAYISYDDAVSLVRDHSMSVIRLEHQIDSVQDRLTHMRYSGQTFTEDDKQRALDKLRYLRAELADAKCDLAAAEAHMRIRQVEP